MKRAKIRPNDICVYDVNNTLKNSVTAPTHMIALERVKYRPFGNSIWKCSNLEDDSAINYAFVTEKLLTPAAIAIVRNPANMPIINDGDINLIKQVLSLENNVLKKGKVAGLDMKPTEDMINGLNKLLIKFETLSKMQNI